jgi:hypothetical protein
MQRVSARWFLLLLTVLVTEVTLESFAFAESGLVIGHTETRLVKNRLGSRPTT